jgi:hypothetical protein
MQSKLTVDEMFSGQCTAYLFDQAPKQREQIVLRITDDLELVTRRMATPKLEGIESDPRPEQTGAEVELVHLSSAISESYRLELDVLELVQSTQFGYFHVEALATKLAISAFHGAVANNVVARRDLPTSLATDFLDLGELG